ncbi:MAG: HsdR family type I site-specific deoxyribonuclease [Cyanobacteria bacterium SBLK]|nr:HsdR family type I site-specific deoxyribonuclease [Cyanobacteria bacterium SBLK]
MSETSAVQKPMIKYANEIGWEYLSQKEALQRREGKGKEKYKERYFTDILRKQLIKLNPNIVTEKNVEEILNRLRNIENNIAGNRQTLYWLQGKESIFVETENREKNITLIDFNHPENNLFHVTEEWTQQGTAFNNRADVLFLINGIPIALAETKGESIREGLAEGIDQIRRYHRQTPEIFAFPQIFEVTELWNFWYGLTWNTSRKNLFQWKTKEDENIAEGDYEDKIKTFFDRLRFLKILQYYIVFLERDEGLTKVILRQHQTRAVEKAIKRIQDPDKNKGLIWHTQGSGKTLTIITIAALLQNLSRDNTIIAIVDRNELENQLDKNLNAYGIKNYELAANKNELRKLIQDDYRGLIVAMIHKFDKMNVRNDRASITILVDEAHRTTGGDLGTYLMASLPNATLIGFTGTPIGQSLQGRSTFETFGHPGDRRRTLDQYSTADSIRDGTTLKLNYALARSEFLVDTDILNREFLQLQAAEGLSDFEELQGILDRAVGMKEFLKSSDRADKIARFIADHFQQYIEPMGFKAFLVAVDREACTLYKQALDRYLPPDYSTVVYSRTTAEGLREYNLSSDREKTVRKNFINKTELPKILIVTEKLLTGFDAPILYCMYLDKPMRDHVLLQAIARVNRPYEDSEGSIKPFGFVLDFIGVFGENLERALAFESEEIHTIIQNVDVIKNQFRSLMEETAPQYLPLTRGWDDKAKERVAVHFSDSNLREEFFQFVRRLQSYYEILSPDPELRPFLEDYQAIIRLYGTIRAAYNTTPYIDIELTAKTRELVRRNVTLSELEMPGKIGELNAETLEQFRTSNIAATVKVLNMSQALFKNVREQSQRSPFLLSIGERAEKVRQDLENRQIDAEEALKRLDEIAGECVQAEAERQQLKLDENTYAIYTIIRKAIPTAEIQQAKAIDAIYTNFPDYQWDVREEIDLRTELYAYLHPIANSIEKTIAIANQLLKLERV